MVRESISSRIIVQFIAHFIIREDHFLTNIYKSQ